MVFHHSPFFVLLYLTSTVSLRSLPSHVECLLLLQETSNEDTSGMVYTDAFGLTADDLGVDSRCPLGLTADVLGV